MKSRLLHLTNTANPTWVANRNGSSEKLRQKPAGLFFYNESKRDQEAFGLSFSDDLFES